MRALEKDRDRRYQTANRLAMDIQRHLADQPVEARPPSDWYRFGKFARRNKTALGMVCVILGALLTSVVALAISDRRVRAKNLEVTVALAQTKVEERQKSKQLWRSLVAQGRANRLSRRPGQRFESLEILRQAATLGRSLKLPDGNFDELRDAVIATLALPDLYPAGPWRPMASDTYAIDFDEAGDFYAITDRRGICAVHRAADDGEVHRLPGCGTPATLRFGPDGEYLAVAHFRDGPRGGPVAVEVWRLGSGEARKILSEDLAHAVAFHPTRPRIALTYADGAIGLFELPDGRPLRRFPAAGLTREVKIALHPTESICSYFGAVVLLRDLNTGEVLATLPRDRLAFNLAWSPDGGTLAVGQGNGSAFRIQLYDRATLQVARTLTCADVPAGVAFNPAGDRLATTGWGRNLELFDVGTGRTLFAARPVASAFQPRFSRDGQQLTGAVADGALGSFQVGDGREYRTLFQQSPHGIAGRSRPAVSTDGRLAAIGGNGGISLWNLAGGDELAFVPTSLESINRVLFEPSGAILSLTPTGLSRWPVAPDPTAPGRLVVGPPEPLPLPVTCSRGVGQEEPHAGGWILHADRPDQPIHLDPGADIGWVVVSPDGRWVITAVHALGLAKIWDAEDGRWIGQLVESGAGYPRFSPDGR